MALLEAAAELVSILELVTIDGRIVEAARILELGSAARLVSETAARRLASLVKLRA